MPYTFEAIGRIHSPYREKFGIPRQPSLVPSARVTLELLPPYNQPDTVRGLDAFSHLWLSFVFHETIERGWAPLVRPPRLGGNARVGVFASRSTHRPNPIGLSLVELVAVDTRNGVTLTLAGADLVDGTPVLDIKPYIPFAESRPDARGGFVDGPPPTLAVAWSEAALETLATLAEPPPGFATLIDEVLAQDPRPAYQDDPTRVYGVRLYCYNVRFSIAGNTATVLEIQTPPPN
ncbi:tRNA (N6-threonylcarbamoyladenosine(37)-N6)-methyltransferase TrmO [Crenobacter cavernae]|uniref:tRNA (N6-threonylcarbamoyladenosine(37)-N6)-methyltransferase TrmO n=1 Tax=Crenobacter cavernae TaxID=2290923 RepID=A0A345Y5K6_9NEIS|nr:tRNA (N6-threonylcarbamoyladenosine(37)-N6)-methyltransferase TrmO [Crenobacter cavernae]AXK39208.1 tRNA (N6-threonylcarbamoyladenosine(37)-N6)-methyltransferase TrmO [Crenobacter cavernae]